MKILRLSPYIINSVIPEHSKNYTGFGRSVWDISRYSKLSGNEEFVYTFHNKNQKIVDGVVMLDGTIKSVLRHITFGTLYLFTKILFILPLMRKNKLKRRLSYLIYSLTYGHIKYLIREVNPDIIHLHGLTYGTIAILSAVQKSGYPYLVTLHGLNMEVLPDRISRNYEIHKIKCLNQKGIYITIIGSGMLSKIQDKCLDVDLNFIITINHGVDNTSLTAPKINRNTILEKFNVGNRKVITSVGSLIERKNHSFLIESIYAMNKSERDKLIVFIVGDGLLKKQIQDQIDSLNLSDTVKLLGKRNHQELSELYSISHLTVLFSKIEGFGRPILESFLFGVPVLSFADLDAVKDLYSEGCLYLIEERDQIIASHKILELLSHNHDHEKIRKYSKTKTWISSVEKYNDIYRKISLKS